jgi:hypothetical protein
MIALDAPSEQEKAKTLNDTTSRASSMGSNKILVAETLS